MISVCVPICIFVDVYLYIYMHGACMYWTLANKPGFPGLRGVSKTSLWLGVMMSWCHASHIWFLCKHQAKKKQKLLLKRRCCFFTWASQGERNKKKDLRLSVVNSYLLRVSCHHMFLAFSCYFVFIKGLNSYSVIWGIFFGITTRMLKKYGLFTYIEVSNENSAPKKPWLFFGINMWMKSYPVIIRDSGSLWTNKL